MKVEIKRFGNGITPNPTARFADPATSFEAANSIKPDSMRKAYRFIITTLGEHGPLAADEIYAYKPADLRQSESGIRTRRKELERAGYIEYAGYKKRNVRRLHTQVWMLTAEGSKLYTQWTGMPALKTGNTPEKGKNAVKTPEPL
jgi:hypothetical protein